MAEMMKLQVIAPDREFYAGEVSMVELTTTEGNIGIYPQHIPLTAVVSPGKLRMHEAEQVLEAALHSGFMTIYPDHITIMAEIVEWPDEIDFVRAEESRIRAERRLASHESEMDVMRAEMALKRALLRLEMRH